ncbi:hypothetical protein PV327_001471 [Microctonus hyperodae]|uniref:Major facilitator superfamily (MFS) profile domain-containing protein n=1 Tax=Microctonus hyperodae TaxID=165561 RepID=A0AA39G8C7_MICHY|nr:hypothetical protein PV327_001471 [Microctonus hyperodae]
MSPPKKSDVLAQKYINSTPPWIKQEDLKDICTSYDEVEKASPEGPANFEQAISLTGYGKFNYLLLLAILPAGWASIYGSTSMSYILPSAECDLSLTLFDKGLLNSMPFAGMIVTAFLWGFLTDNYGRKKILVWGYLSTSIISLASSFSHASWLLILFKFLNGIITTLRDEDFVGKESTSFMQNFNGGWQQMKPLFKSPYILRLILIGLIQFGGTIGSNTLRLWMPQLFSMIETYEEMHPQNISGPYPSICVMLERTNSTFHNVNTYVNHTMIVEKICAPVVLNSTVYLNSMVIAVTGVIGYTLAGSLINCAGTKTIMVFCFLTAGLCCGILYWARDSNGILGISSVFVALSSIGGAAVTNVIVDNFPTSLRAMAIAMTMMLGRVGAVVGNLLFPVLFKWSCLGPFGMIGIACLICSVLVLFVPRAKSSLKNSIHINKK